MQTVNEIITVLSKLKKLQVHIDITYEDVQQTLSLQKLTSIETLSIRLGGYRLYTDQLLNLVDCNLTNVRDLTLHRCRLSNQVMADLQRTNVSRLTLDNCSFPRLSDLAMLKSLNHVVLKRNNYHSEIDDIDSSCSSIRSLKVVDANPLELLDLTEIFPNLERFEVAGSSNIDEGFFEILSLDSPQLKELVFARNCLFNIREAVNYVPALKTIRIQCSDKERRKSFTDQLQGVSHDVAIEFY